MRLVGIIVALLATFFGLVWPHASPGQAVAADNCKVTLRITEGPAKGDVIVWSGVKVPVPGRTEIAVSVGGQTCWFAHSITDEILAAMRTYNLSNNKKNWMLVVINEDEEPNAAPIENTQRNLPRDPPRGIEMMPGLQIVNWNNSRGDLLSPRECLDVCRDHQRCVAYTFIVSGGATSCSLLWKGMHLNIFPKSRHHSESWAGIARDPGTIITCRAGAACPGNRAQFHYTEVQ